MTPIFQKYKDERVDYSIDYSKLLESGTIVGSEWELSVTPIPGVTLEIVSSTNTDTMATIVVDSGIPGSTYTLINKIDTVS